VTAAVAAAFVPAAATSTCVHCGLPSSGRFCCPGCAAAYATIGRLGLGEYYRRRVLDPAARALRPDAPVPRDWAARVHATPDGVHELQVAVDGLQCGACVWLIESVLGSEPGLVTGRVNMTTRRLKLRWRGDAALAARWVGLVEALGYRLVPFQVDRLAAERSAASRRLVRALAVAGFAAGNVMLMSIATWAGLVQGMGPATRALMHWLSALIALPAIAYAGMPFFTSAVTALRRRRTNMDVPISIGILIVTATSAAETFGGGVHTYFDSAVTLIFFLLVGRVLDQRARYHARDTAEQLLILRAADVTLLLPDGTRTVRAQDAVVPGDRLLVGMGERIGADGVIERGRTSIDASLITGESLPVDAGEGDAVNAGSINLGQPIVVRAERAGDQTVLVDCVRLIDAAEASRNRFVLLADRVARRYAPTVHLTALLTFLGWYFAAGASLHQSLLIASAVLIITCPCALALAVPVVQVITAGALFRRGILLKAPAALERLAQADTVVFDKTGTLTEPSLHLDTDGVDPGALSLAASLAASSRHPLARALAAADRTAAALDDVEETPGQGLRWRDVRLGSRSFCDVTDAPPSDGPELWLRAGDSPQVRFRFAEALRPDARATVDGLRARGLRVLMLSGDRPDSVRRIAGLLGIDDWRAGCSPTAKIAVLDELAKAGRFALMVGDGLNDSPSLAAAHVSMSPASAADLSQTLADIVFQGRSLAPVATAVIAARRAGGIVRENLALSLGYNLLAVPVAICGFVTPWLAAAAMSSSSLLVITNSLRARATRSA